MIKVHMVVAVVVVILFVFLRTLRLFCHKHATMMLHLAMDVPEFKCPKNIKQQYFRHRFVIIFNMLVGGGGAILFPT